MRTSSHELDASSQELDELDTKPVLPYAFDDHADSVHGDLRDANELPASLVKGQEPVADAMAGDAIRCHEAGRPIEAGAGEAGKIAVR